MLCCRVTSPEGADEADAFGARSIANSNRSGSAGLKVSCLGRGIAQLNSPVTSRKSTTIPQPSKRPALIMAVTRLEFDVVVTERAARQ